LELALRPTILAEERSYADTRLARRGNALRGTRIARGVSRVLQEAMSGERFPCDDLSRQAAEPPPTATGRRLGSDYAALFRPLLDKASEGSSTFVGAR
jgi:hypothetical protein